MTLCVQPTQGSHTDQAHEAVSFWRLSSGLGALRAAFCLFAQVSSFGKALGRGQPAAPTPAELVALFSMVLGADFPPPFPM